jgi:hypothetical protein
VIKQKTERPSVNHLKEFWKIKETAKLPVQVSSYSLQQAQLHPSRQMKRNKRARFIQVSDPGERPSANQNELSRRLEAYISLSR